MTSIYSNISSETGDLTHFGGYKTIHFNGYKMITLYNYTY